MTTNNRGKVDIGRMMVALFVICAAYALSFMLVLNEWNWRGWSAGFTSIIAPTAWAYYRGHQHGYDARQAEVEAVISRVAPR